MLIITHDEVIILNYGISYANYDMYYVRYSIIYANYNIRWGNKHYLFRRKRTNFYFTFVILFFRSISPASFKRRNGMLVTCMRPWTKKSQFLMPKGSKRSDETIARPLPRWICWFFSKWFSKYFFFITNQAWPPALTVDCGRLKTTGVQLALV